MVTNFLVQIRQILPHQADRCSKPDYFRDVTIAVSTVPLATLPIFYHLQRNRHGGIACFDHKDFLNGFS